MSKEAKLQTMKCSKCKKLVTNVGENAKTCTCEECVQKELGLALKNQERDLKGGIDNKQMVEETQTTEQSRKDKYKALEPKILEMAKAGKTASEISKELGGSPGTPKIKRIIAGAK